MRLLTIFLFFQIIGQAQQPHFFRHFTEKDGLSNPDVQCILRDRAGWLWVGTTRGLNRFDGRNFRQFLPDASQPGRTVSNENITDIEQDSAGFVWISTRDGLNRFDPRTEVFKVFKNTGHDDGSIPNSLITNILIDKNQKIWLCCDGRDLAVFDPKNRAVKTFPWKKMVENVLPKSTSTNYKTIYFLTKKSDTSFWLHTNFGLFDFDVLEEKFSFFPENFAQKQPKNAPEKCPEKNYLPSWDKDILRFENCTGRFSQVRLPISDALNGGNRQVNSIEKSGGQFWVLARKGLFLMDAKTEKIEAVVPSSANRFSAPTGVLNIFFEEKNGLIWLGGETGLWQFDPRLQHFNYENLLPENTEEFYNTFCRTLDLKVSGQRLILDFYRNKLLVFENKKQRAAINLPGRAALLFEDRSGKIWVGGGKNIFHFDPKTLKIKPFEIPAHLFGAAENSIFQGMAEDAAGNFWFANNKSGLLVFCPADGSGAKSNDGSWWKPGEADGFISSAAACVFSDPSQRTIWVGTEDFGLFRFDEKTRNFQLFQHEETRPKTSLGAFVVFAICRDGAGKIWVATDPGGVSCFDYSATAGQEFFTLGTTDGLPSNQVYSLVADRAGNIWAGTAEGLAWIDFRTRRVRSWTKNEGLENDFFDLPLQLGRDGEVISGSKYGQQWWQPDSVLAEKTDSRVLLTAFKIFDKNFADTLNINHLQKIDLSWREDFFSFEFASAEFSQPEKNEFRYRLTGFDADWNFTKTGRAAYTNVPPGQYFLEIISGREGRWNENGLRLAIQILPPFWQTWWFRLLVFGAICGSILAIYRYRVGQIRREEQLKTEFNRRLGQVEMTALRAQMNPHFVFNCLNSINRFILVNEPDAASMYLTKFSRLIRLILDNSRSETVPLDKELEALKLYIEMEAMRFDKRFDYEISVAPGLQTEHLEVPPLLVQPFVENAIWHGLMHKKEKGKLVVRVRQEAQNLVIEIEDNGIGRQKAGELKSKSATAQKSHGLQVTAERLEIINTVFGTAAAAEIVDLFDSHGEPNGTRVLIRI